MFFTFSSQLFNRVIKMFSSYLSWQSFEIHTSVWTINVIRGLILVLFCTVFL